MGQLDNPAGGAPSFGIETAPTPGGSPVWPAGGFARHRLKLGALVCVMYLTVSGGAYGLEDAVRIAGPRLAMILCLVVPLMLSLPTALMAAELTALIPAQGGFYVWVKEAFGPFAGFVEAYLTMLYTAVDMAIYPVLFAAYLSFLIPLTSAEQIALGIVLVWLSGGLNLLGVRPVGRTSVVLTIAILTPFLAMVVLGIPRLAHWQPPAGPIFGHDFAGALGGGLSVVIWNFCGFENLSVVAAEIEHPQRNYLRAIGIVLPLVVLGYLLPLAVALDRARSGAGWETGSFTRAGAQLGGPLLGLAIGLGGALGSFAIFESAMLWVSRMPFVLACDNYLPKPLAEIRWSSATPGKSILLCCMVFTLLVPLGFVTLVVLDVFFYMGALMLEMGALVRLRRIHPARDGLFAIGGGHLGLATVVAAPILIWIATFGLAVSESPGHADFVTAIVLAAAVWPVYAFCRRRYGGAA
jgi:amino acid transporter